MGRGTVVTTFPDPSNALMSGFPAVEADELVTKQLLRAELAEVRTEMAEVRTEIAEVRGEMHQAMHRQSVTIVGLVIAATAAIEALTTLL